jgi:hypothetical protein
LAKIKEGREACGCEALWREPDALLEQARAIRDRIFETQANSFAGILAQLEILKDESTKNSIRSSQASSGSQRQARRHEARSLADRTAILWAASLALRLARRLAPAL